MRISWTGFKDDHTDITKIEWCVDLCTKASCGEFSRVQGDVVSIELAEADYNFGSKMVADKFYCATLRVTNAAGLQTNATSAKALYIQTEPKPGRVSDGADANRDLSFQRDTTKLSACWSGFPLESKYFKAHSPLA